MSSPSLFRFSSNRWFVSVQFQFSLDSACIMKTGGFARFAYIPAGANFFFYAHFKMAATNCD